MSARKLAIARRKAMSESGKQASGTQGRTASDTHRATAPQTSAPAPQRARSEAPQKRRTAKTAPSVSGSARAASLARRKAMSTRGKSAVPGKDRTRGNQDSRKPAIDPKTTQTETPRAEEKHADCGCGGQGKTSSRPASRPSSRPNSTRANSARSNSARANGGNGKHKMKQTSIDMSPARAASLARRKAQSTRGKGGISQSGMSPAQTVRSSNPDLSSRELAKKLREQRSKRGRTGQKKSAPTGRRRPKVGNQNEQGASKDQPWKVGISETVQGQQVSGTMTGRSLKMTGDEASTCRSITGTEYMGADLFRDFCQIEPVQASAKVGRSATSRGKIVTGPLVGRGQNVTGDEPGTCKAVTGTEYVGAEQNEAYCGIQSRPNPSKIGFGRTAKDKPVTGNLDIRSENVTGDEVGANRRLTGSQYTQPGEIGNVPAKVRASSTMRGKTVTGPLVGRSEKMTGDEMGSCRNITGDEYIAAEQFRSFCETAPEPADQKVGVSATMGGESITGTMTGRAGKVTGDEPGTCKAITGTPYAGVEQYGVFCEAPVAQQAASRMQASKRVAGAPMTGIQPAVGGDMTGDHKGVCQDVSGTPYVGADQQGTVCPSRPAESHSPDFPQALGEQPWGQFSTTQPNHAVHMLNQLNGDASSASEKGQITGPFDMAPGMVTGTDRARFGDAPLSSLGRNGQVQPQVPEMEVSQTDGRVKSRISGEGMDGMKITGDAWDRGDRVTGTEGPTAKRRNPTRRGEGNVASMAMSLIGSRDEETPLPVSKVTGSSGNTDQGSLITYSGGARG